MEEQNSRQEAPVKRKGIMTWPEKMVAAAMKEAGILWKYEWETVLKHGNGYEGVRYPDFYLPEADIYVEVLSLNPTEEGRRSLRRKLEFYDKNDLDYFLVDVRKGKAYKSVPELKDEVEEQVYSRALAKDLPRYSAKRFIDDFQVSRNGYRRRADYKVA